MELRETSECVQLHTAIENQENAGHGDDRRCVSFFVFLNTYMRKGHILPVVAKVLEKISRGSTDQPLDRSFWCPWHRPVAIQLFLFSGSIFIMTFFKSQLFALALLICIQSASAGIFSSFRFSKLLCKFRSRLFGDVYLCIELTFNYSVHMKTPSMLAPILV